VRCRYSVLTTVFCLALAACTAAPTGPVEPLRYTLQEQRFESRGCARAGQPCAEVLMRYPEFTQEQAPALVDAMQRWIEQQMSVHGIDGQPAESPRVAARTFIEGFEQHVAESPDQATDWFDRRRVEVLYEDAQVISLAFEMSSFAGGAHPMSMRRLASFDRASAQQLRLEDVVRPDAMRLLTDLVTRAVRTDLGIAPQVDLADAGFFVDDNRIPPPDNFAVTAEGWLLHYDPYEIAPYAMGPIEIRLGFREIENVARAGTPASPRSPPLILEED